MYLTLLLVLVVHFATIKADLVCLGWGLISPVVGLICHFQPQAFHAVENNTVAAVDAAVRSAEDLVQFDLTHNPATVTYNFLSKTDQGGIGQGVEYLANTGADFGDITIGFAKESANQLVQLYDLTHWNDVSFCLITGAGHLASQTTQTSRKRAGVPTGVDAVKMAQGCISDKLKQFSKPAVFKITSPNQQVGSTISDIASLLVPVGIEDKAATTVAQGAVDLAIPGSEDTTRVLKRIDEGTFGQHFTSEAEAQAVAENMQDESWVKDNCAICAPPLPPGIINSRKSKRRNVVPLNRRGNVMASCCKLPATIVDPVADLDTTFDEGESIDETTQEDQEDATDHLDDPTYDPENYNAITEDSLTPAPSYKDRDVSITDDLDDLENDLHDLSTGVTSWSPALQAVTSSDELFTSLHNVFTGPSTDPLYSSLQIMERDGKLRLTTFSEWWISNPDPSLKPLQDFVNAAVQQAIDTVGKLQKLTPDQAAGLKGTVEFFYTAPSQEALAGVDPRGFHIDKGLMQFGAADTPGLIIRNTGTGEASRVPVVKDAFQLFKGTGWDMHAYIQGLPNGPTWHSVFGPEMAKSGRVSIVMTVFTKGTYV